MLKKWQSSVKKTPFPHLPIIDRVNNNLNMIQFYGRTMKHPVDFLFENAHGKLWLKEMQLTQISDQTSCYDCDRLASDWPSPNLGVVRDGKARCTSCHMLCEGSFELLGVNSIKAHKSKKYDNETQKVVNDFLAKDPFAGVSGHGLDYRPVLDEEDVICDDCEKPSSRWKEPHRGLKIKLDGAKKLVCTSCQLKYESRIRLLDNPHVKGRGYPDAGKLNMMTGCAMLVTQSRTLLGLNHTVKPATEDKSESISGFFTRFNISPNSPYEMLPLTHGNFIAHLVKNPPKPPFILIDEICKSNTELVRNLKVTEDLSCTYLCSNEGVRQLDLLSIGDFFEVVARAKTSKERNDIANMLSKILKGVLSLDSEEMTKFFSKKPIAKQIYELLPSNPWQGLDMLYLSRKL